MKLAERIFRRNDYYITSKFGLRDPFATPNGVTNPNHIGTDYGTHNQKWNQYALEDGVVALVDKDEYGAIRIFVNYPRIGIRLMHAHNDKAFVKTGQKVNANTILGTTGKTGKSTGIHLHLGLRKIGNATWLDPEKYDYQPVVIEPELQFIGTVLSKNTDVNQVEVKVTNLRVRDTPNGKILGYANVGLYNYLQTKLDGNYMWYEIEPGRWVAHRDEWLNVYFKLEPILPTPDPIVPEPVIPEPEPTPEPEPLIPDKSTKPSGELIWVFIQKIIKIIVDFFNKTIDKKSKK